MQEDYLADIDGGAIVAILPQKIAMAKQLVTDSALDLTIVETNPDAGEADVEQIRRLYRARKYQLDQFTAMLDRFQKAAKGE